MARRFFLLVFFLHGCVSIPDHELAQVAISSGLDQNATIILASGEILDGWPNAEWWKSFCDPALDHLIELALKESPTLKLAEERLKSAHQITNEKRSALFPEIDFDGNDNYQHFSKYGFFRSLSPQIPAVANDIALNLTYKWELDFWGKQHKILEAAIGEARAAAAECEAAKLILTTSIAYDYTELQFLLRKKELLEQKKHNETAIWNVRQGRQNHAIDAAMTTLGAQIELLNNEAMLVELDEEIQHHIHEIKALSGLGQNADLTIHRTELIELRASLPATISLDLLARRPDLAAQKQRVEAAAFLIGAAKTDFYPSINLIGFAGLESLTWGKIFRFASFNGSLEPAIHLPIFTAGRIKSQLKGKVAEFNQAVESYNELILQAAKEVTDNLSMFMRIQKELDVRLVSLAVASEQEAIAKRRFEHALDTKISVFMAQNNLLDTQLLLTSLEYGKQLANILLIRSLGGGTNE
jgi:NodT family efflux transporter outer membrane factor (OMF) lipoprotein